MLWEDGGASSFCFLVFFPFSYVIIIVFISVKAAWGQELSEEEIGIEDAHY